MHAVSYQRLSRLLGELFGLAIPLDALASGSEGALDAAFRRGKPLFDADVAAILARLRRARVICSDEASVRIDGRTCWNWVFPAETLGFSENSEVVIQVIRRSRGAGVVAKVLDGRRPALWVLYQPPYRATGIRVVFGARPPHQPRAHTGQPKGLPVSDLHSAQQGHAEEWQICLAHHLRDCAYAIEAGDAVFAPRMKALLLRAVVLARRSRGLAPSTRREYRRRLECALDAVMALAPTHRDGRRLRRRCGKLRSHLFTFPDHPEAPADNNGSERELRPTATYRKVIGGFRSDWGADLFAGVRSVNSTAARRGMGAYQAVQQTSRGQAATYPG